MRFLEKISLRLKYYMLMGMIFIFAVISVMSLIHTMNSITSYRQLEKDFDNYFNILHTIDHQLLEIELTSPDSLSAEEPGTKSLLNSIEQFSSDIRKIKDNILVSGDSAVQSDLGEFLEFISKFEAELKNNLSEGSTDISTDISDVHNSYVDPMIEKRVVLRDNIFDLSFTKQKKFSINLLIVLLLNLLIIGLLVSFNSYNSSRNLNTLLGFIRQLEKGSKIDKLFLGKGIEFYEISRSLNSFLDKQAEKIRYLKTIGEGNDQEQFEPDKSDILGNEIKVMADRLADIQSEKDQRQAEERKLSWNTEGIAQFAEILRSERENVKELSYLIVQKLVTYLKIEMGSILLTSDEEGEEKVLNTVAAYAYDRRKYIDKSFRFGEGLPGTCALEKEKIYINEIPDDYSDVISGVGRAKPRYVLLVPLKIEEQIFGILELASFRAFDEHELSFLDQLAESIASTLLAVKTNEQTASLLRQSQEQAKKLLRQEEEMKNNLSELERAQEESIKKEVEITGILNAMNESSLVAEFTVNGRYSDVNEKFIHLFESPRELILGKHHSEFCMDDKYSDAYKKFWSDLKNGEIISKEEQIKLYNGKELWLQQTYTPIKNPEGKVFKILNIAVDITKAKVQQENLKKQASEITRQNLEMESLNEAVNTAIIKCELDREGIILDTNQNFESISGYNRKEILGRNYRLFLKDMEKEQFEKIWQEVSKGKTYQGAIRRTKPTGEEAWLMSTFSPVKDEANVIYKIYFLALDITEKRLKYQLLEEANKEIDRLRNKDNM